MRSAKVSFYRIKTIPATALAGLLMSCAAPSTKSAKTNPQPVQAEAEQQPTRQVVPPEIVRSKSMRIVNGLKILTMTNANGDYLLSCSLKAGESCITPATRKKLFIVQ